MLGAGWLASLEGRSLPSALAVLLILILVVILSLTRIDVRNVFRKKKKSGLIAYTIQLFITLKNRFI